MLKVRCNSLFFVKKTTISFEEVCEFLRVKRSANKSLQNVTVQRLNLYGPRHRMSHEEFRVLLHILGIHQLWHAINLGWPRVKLSLPLYATWNTLLTWLTTILENYLPYQPRRFTEDIV